MGDHSSAASGGLIHSGEPVPVMFIGDGIRRDNVTQFDEVNVAGGALGFLRGDEILHMILNHLDRHVWQVPTTLPCRRNSGPEITIRFLLNRKSRSKTTNSINHSPHV